MYIKVRAIAGAKKEEVILEKPDHFKIFVREEAEQNMANERIIALVANHFKIEPAKIRIINGHHSPSKLLSVDV